MSKETTRIFYQKREDKIAQLREDGMTYEAIGHEIGLTRERIQQIMAQRKKRREQDDNHH